MLLLLFLGLLVACGGGGGDGDASTVGGGGASDAADRDGAAVLDVPVPGDAGATTVDLPAAPDDGGAGPDLPAPEPDLPLVADVPPPPPAGPPEPPGYSGRSCPTFAAGTNTFESDGRTRKFELYLPGEPKDAPLLFVWHGVGDTPTNAAAGFGASSVTAGRGGIVVAPYDCCGSGNAECCNQLFVWTYADTSSTQPDMTLFDDLLSCLHRQFDYDEQRVYSTSFSAGSLWTTHLLMHRAEYLAAVAIFSGGVGQNIQSYHTPARKVPALLAWGGTNDTYAMGYVKFYELMANLMAALLADGHFVVACDHGLGHTVPWGCTPWIHEFLFAHTWSTGTSPFAAAGLSDLYPDYCEIP